MALFFAIRLLMQVGPRWAAVSNKRKLAISPYVPAVVQLLSHHYCSADVQYEQTSRYKITKIILQTAYKKKSFYQKINVCDSRLWLRTIQALSTYKLFMCVQAPSSCMPQFMQTIFSRPPPRNRLFSQHVLHDYVCIA